MASSVSRARLESQLARRALPVLPLRPGQVEQRTHDDTRRATLSFFAALGAATGKVTGRCYPRHRGREFLSFPHEIERNVPTKTVATRPTSRLSLARSSRGSRPISPRMEKSSTSTSMAPLSSPRARTAYGEASPARRTGSPYTSTPSTPSSPRSPKAASRLPTRRSSAASQSKFCRPCSTAALARLSQLEQVGGEFWDWEGGKSESVQ